MGQILQLAAEIWESLTTLQSQNPTLLFLSLRLKKAHVCTKPLWQMQMPFKTSEDWEAHLKAWPCPACTVEPFVSTAVVTLPVPILSTVKLQADKDEQYSAKWTGTDCPALQRGPPKLSCLMQTHNITSFTARSSSTWKSVRFLVSCQSPTEDKAGTF